MVNHTTGRLTPSHIVDDAQLAVITGHNSHSRKRSRLLRLKLGIAAGDNNFGMRIAASKRAYGLTAFLVGNLGDAACVDHYIVGHLALGNTHNALGLQQ